MSQLFRSIDCIESFQFPSDLRSIHKIIYKDVRAGKSDRVAYSIVDPEYSHDIFNMYELTRPEGKTQVQSTVHENLRYPYKLNYNRLLYYTVDTENPQVNEFFEILRISSTDSYVAILTPKFVHRLEMYTKDGTTPIGYVEFKEGIHIGDKESCQVYLRLSTKKVGTTSRPIIETSVYLDDRYVDYLMSNSIGEDIISSYEFNDLMRNASSIVDKNNYVRQYDLKISDRDLGKIDIELESEHDFVLGLGYNTGEVVNFRGDQYECLIDSNLDHPLSETWRKL